MTDRLADKVDVNSLYFEKSTRVRNEKAVVTFAASTKTLYFNPKMTTLLNIANWKAVLAGCDEKTGMIILKEVQPDEYGSVAVRQVSSGANDKDSTKERAKVSRVVYIGHLIASGKVTIVKAYRGERDGMMVFLEGIESSGK